jgi:hypothetical protein
MTLFLILHKVRGEPAFDIADQLQIGDEVGWIIPTSGHRAYPYIYWPLTPQIDLGPSSDPNDIILYKDDWAGWPDHYTQPDLPAAGPKKSLTSLLGFVRAPLRLRRIDQ